MMRKVLAVVQDLLPLEIKTVEWNDPILSLGGKGWSISISSPWRIISEESVSFGSWEMSSGRQVETLCGVQVTEVGIQSTSIEVDPFFVLSNGQRLEIFSADGYETWVLRLPTITFVASPTDPSWVKPDIQL
jgi:hypothetical protein